MRTGFWVACLILLLASAIAHGQVRIVRVVGGRVISPEPPPAPGSKEAAKPSVEPVDPEPDEAKRIDELIEQLGAPRLAQRDRAMAELAAFEAKALGQVRKAKGHSDDEIAHRCAVLEDVIQTRQAELFLAARSLSLEPTELERLIAADDVRTLLGVLRSRAQPGLTALWARVLAKLASRPQVVPAARLCLEAEGTDGYGLALADAARQRPMTPAQASGLVRLLGLIPPPRASHAVETLAFCAAGGGPDTVHEALRTAAALRGLYPTPQLIAASRAISDPRRALPEDKAALRPTMALALSGPAVGEEVAEATLPKVVDLSPLALQEYLEWLGRSGRLAALRAAITDLSGAQASPRALTTAGAAWANHAPVAEIATGFESLPHAARLGVLDALWLNPREPRVLQPFLLRLLQELPEAADAATWRQAAALMLGQYRAPGTALALAQSALDHADTAGEALNSLVGMADLLPPDVVSRLTALLDRADASTRPVLVHVLVESGDAAAQRALLARWKLDLPLNECGRALTLLARDTTSPVGACSAVLTLGHATRLRRERFFAGMNPRMLLLVKSLLGADEESGFALLGQLAQDEGSYFRPWAAGALALAGRDESLIGDWVRRLAGQVPDRNPAALVPAIGLSRRDEAAEFRARVLSQGSASPHAQCLVVHLASGLADAEKQTAILRVLFDTPASARRWLSTGMLLTRRLPPSAQRNVAQALLFNEDMQLLDSPVHALMLAESGLDVLDLMYGRDATPPRDAMRLVMTGLLGESARAHALLQAAQPDDEGANHGALAFARAWAGPQDAESTRLVRAGLDTATLTAFALRRDADSGNAAALRALLDRFGGLPALSADGATASLQVTVERWRGSSVQATGVLPQALGMGAATDLPGWVIARYFADMPGDDWEFWWASRRGLLQYNAEAGRYQFEELP